MHVNLPNRGFALMLAGSLLAGLSLASPASAQGMPSSNLNGVNNSLAQQSQTRELQQQQTTDTNQLRMQNQRNETFRQDAPSTPLILPKR